MTIGLLADFGVKQELVYGTAVSPSDAFIDILSESIASDNAILTPKTCSGSRTLRRVLPGPYRAGGDVSMLANPEGVPIWLMKGLFGQVSSVDLEGGAFQHTFESADNSTLPSFTCYTNRVAGQQFWVGSVVSQLAISANVDEAVQLTFSMVAKKPQNTTEQTAVYDTIREHIWSDAAVVLNSEANTKIENMSFTISNAVEGVATHDATRFINFAVATDFSVEGSFDLEFNDKVQLQRFWGATDATEPQNTVLANDLLVTWTSPDQISASGEYYTLELHIPELIYSAGEPTVSGPNARIMQPFAFVGREGETEGYSVRMRVTNSETEYADPS